MSNKVTEHPRRKSCISGQFSPRLVEMLESPAYRTMSLSAHRVISRIEIELAAHGGNDNGSLPVTYQDFIDYGIVRELIAGALREAAALGFIEITKHGRGGNAEYREPTLFRLTFAHDRNSRQRPPTHEWRRIKSIEDAQQIARAARASKNPAAVAKGQRNHRNKNRNQYGKMDRNQSTNPHRKPKVFSPETHTTGSVQKPVLLSISGVGGGAPKPRFPLSISTQKRRSSS